MRQILNWYPLLEGSGLAARDMGPANKPGTLSANVTWCPYYYPPGILYGYKGVTIAASQSRIISAAAAGFNAAEGSIEMLVKPSWDYTDGKFHVLWFTTGGPGKEFLLAKYNDNVTYFYTNSIYRGGFTFAWTANAVYHVVLNWGTNQLYINKVLKHTFSAGGLGDGAAELWIGDCNYGINWAFSGNIYYFIARDVPLTQAEINAFYEFFYEQYIAVDI